MLSKSKWYKPVVVGLTILSVFQVIFFSYMAWITQATDWSASFRPAILGLFSGTTYNFTVFNPPWILALLYPIAVLPNQIGNLTMTLISLGILIFVARRNKMSLLSFLFAMSMPQMAFVVCNGGTDSLTILGFVLNPVVGLFFVLIKPQLSIGVLLFWLIEAWNKGKIKQVVNVFLPAGLVYGLFLVYYFTHQHNGGMDYLLKAYWNTAIWPGGIPIGLGLLLHAIRSKRKGIFILSSPFFAPYIARYTWAMPIFGSNLDDLEMFIVWIGMWIVTIIKFSGG